MLSPGLWCWAKALLRSAQIESSQAAANHKRVVAARFQQIVGFFQKAAQGLANQSSPHRRLHSEFPGPKAPAKAPNPTIGIDFPLNGTLLPRAAGNLDVGSGLRQSAHPASPDGIPCRVARGSLAAASRSSMGSEVSEAQPVGRDPLNRVSSFDFLDFLRAAATNPPG